MKVKYFAWVRERIGKAEETVEPPAGVRTVDDLIGWLARRGETYAYAFEKPKVIRAAIDHAHVKPDADDRRRPRDRVLPADDRRLTFAGHDARHDAATIRIQEADFDIAQEIAALTKGRTDIGAVVSFSGICRGSENGEPIAALTLEHYPGMAEAEIKRHADEAMSRWPLTGLTVIHRVGRITPGENIVLVLTASAHRQAAFQAAEFLMDYLKANAPFWKREESPKGTELDRGAQP
jgi:molybdopterin synthase catalytic subunit